MKAVVSELLKVARSLIASGWGRFSGDLDDVLSAQVHIHKNKSKEEIAKIIKRHNGISGMMKEEGMKDEDLNDYLDENLKLEGVLEKAKTPSKVVDSNPPTHTRTHNQTAPKKDMDWWKDQTPDFKREYLKDHPSSKYRSM